jgi:hypothetical protein
MAIRSMNAYTLPLTISFWKETTIHLSGSGLTTMKFSISAVPLAIAAIYQPISGQSILVLD